jgi:hypothetical protein
VTTGGAPNEAGTERVREPRGLGGQEGDVHESQNVGNLRHLTTLSDIRGHLKRRPVPAKTLHPETRVMTPRKYTIEDLKEAEDASLGENESHKRADLGKNACTGQDVLKRKISFMIQRSPCQLATTGWLKHSTSQL